MLAVQVAAQELPVREVQITSSRDGVQQSALFYVPPGSEPGAKKNPAPLLVCLHSWSTNYKSAEYTEEILEGCRNRGWVFLSPDFRGPNKRMEACASDLAVQDVIDAVQYARQHANVDPRRIWLVGGSGGGHMALLMAGRAPGLWSAVSAWVPITDLAAWYQFCKEQNFHYWEMMELCCGGPPGNPPADREFKLRSPLFHLEKAKLVPIDIEVGIHDGHNGAAVPISHSLWAFDALARANGQPASAISDEEIRVMTNEERIPEHLTREREDDSGRKHRILFRRSAGPARLTIFDGGHVLDPQAALRWFESLSSGGPASIVWHRHAVKLDFGKPVWYRLNTSEWVSGTETNVTREGVNRVTVRKTKDAVDEEVREIRVDISPPIIKLVAKPPLDQEGGIYFAGPDTVFTFEVSDKGSGVAGVEISSGNDEYVLYRGSLKLPPGSHELRCRAVDIAGNQSDVIRGESLSGGETNVIRIEVK
ncbi:MAG: prolyl oligopeptidase family serine peptidase [Acidobacteriales bacterium]|nr:prolyl oligopeptidase family serine peptidase [Terriglobales bacterium]